MRKFSKCEVRLRVELAFVWPEVAVQVLIGEPGTQYMRLVAAHDNISQIG